MFSLEVDYLVGQEQHEDRRRATERRQLMQITRVGKLDNQKPLRKMAGWFGTRLVVWGLKLQRYQPATQQR